MDIEKIICEHIDYKKIESIKLGEIIFNANDNTNDIDIVLNYDIVIKQPVNSIVVNITPTELSNKKKKTKKE